MPADPSLLAGGDSCCCHCFRVSPEIWLEWGSLPPNLCSSLLSFVIAEASPIRNGDRRVLLPRCPSRPRFGKQNLPPNLCSRCRLQPPFPLPPRLVVAPVGCSPRPDVSPLYHQAAHILVPAPSETCWFRGMSVGGSFRRV